MSEKTHGFLDFPGIAFQMGGAEGREILLNQAQVTSRLASMGLSTNSSPGFHLLPGGGAVVIRKEQGYTLQRVDGECLNAARALGNAAVRKFAEAAHRIMQSQQIANLSALIDAIKELQTSGIIKCSSSQSFAARLEILTRACEEWAAARSKVARLLHQTKARQLQIEMLKKKVDTLRDALGKDKDAVSAAMAVENGIVTNKKELILSLTHELREEAADLLVLTSETAMKTD